MAKKRCRRVKSGPRKGRCRLKKKGRKSSKRSARARKRTHCVKLRGKKRAVRCYSSPKAALRRAAILRRKGKDAVVRGGTVA